MNDCHYEKDYLVYTLPNISKLHIVQLHVVQKYMEVAFVEWSLLQVWESNFEFLAYRFPFK